MRFEVRLSDAAVRDLEEIHEFILQNDSPTAAAYVLDGIEKAFLRLEEFPHRGNHPKELLFLGEKEYREIFFKPYRLIYSVEDLRVIVHLIADGRRDMQTLLAARLLGG